MIKISLKSLLKPSKSAAHLLSQFRDELQLSFSVQDIRGRWVWGESLETQSNKFPISFQEQTIGWVYGNEQADTMASLLSHLASKEYEKKQLGSEVLDLYREINLIYNFSEKLGKALDAEMIAQTALEEVQQLIEASGGACIYLPEGESQPQVLAQIGSPFFAESDLSLDGAISAFLHSSQANILNDVQTAFGKGQPQLASLIHAPLKVKHRLLGVMMLVSETPTEYKAAHLKLLTTLAMQSASAIESALLFKKRIQEAEEREEAIRRIHEVTTRFVPYEFISALGREKLTEVMLGDQVQRDVTVFFSDIREYTTLAESMSPEDNFRFVSAYNSRMGPVIYENRGFVNQYLGDGIMAIFPKDPYDALKAAIQMQKTLRTYNQERIAMQREPIRVGMGLHTGPLIMGIIGDVQRMEAATIADTVNTAARIESLTKYYGTNILVSGDSLKEIAERPPQPGVDDSFSFRFLGQVQVKGRHEPVAIYECFDGDESDQIIKKKQTASLFSDALREYYDRNFETAVSNLRKVLTINPVDLTAKLLLNRIEGFVHSGVPDGWTGVEKMSSK